MGHLPTPAQAPPISSVSHLLPRPPPFPPFLPPFLPPPPSPPLPSSPSPNPPPSLPFVMYLDFPLYLTRFFPANHSLQYLAIKMQEFPSFFPTSAW